MASPESEIALFRERLTDRVITLARLPAEWRDALFDSLTVGTSTNLLEIRFGFLGETNDVPWDGSSADLDRILEDRAESYSTTLKIERTKGRLVPPG